MTPRRSAAHGARLVAGKRRAALALVFDAVDAILEDGIGHPDWSRADASLRTCALEVAFEEAEEVVGRLRATGVVPAPMTNADAGRLVAAAASICVWGRIPGRAHPVLDHLAAALAAVPGTPLPLALLA